MEESVKPLIAKLSGMQDILLPLELDPRNIVIARGYREIARLGKEQLKLLREQKEPYVLPSQRV